MLPNGQDSIIAKRGKFRHELACHENDNKTNNGKFFYKYIWSWVLGRDSVYHLAIAVLIKKQIKRNKKKCL